MTGCGSTGGERPPTELPAARAPAPSPDAIWWPGAVPADRWYPVAALVLPTGQVVVAENHQNRLFQLDGPGLPPKRLAEPGIAPVEWTALSVAPGLSFYALDGPGRRIHQYDYRGNYVGLALDLDALAASLELGPIEPVGLAVDRSGLAVVTDQLGDRLLVFGPGWNYEGEWGQTGSAPGSWRRPGAVAVGERAPYLVADEGNRRLVLVDALGVVEAYRDLDERPLGVAVLARGRYAVTFEDRVELLDSGLVPVATRTIPMGEGCLREPFATRAVAGRPDLVLAGDGCSGRLLQVVPSGK